MTMEYDLEQVIEEAITKNMSPRQFVIVVAAIWRDIQHKRAKFDDEAFGKMIHLKVE